MSTNTQVKFVSSATVQELPEDRAALEARVAADPADPIASVHLERLYRAEEAWDELLELLLSRAEHALSSADGIRSLCAAAAVCRELGDRHGEYLISMTAFRRCPEDRELADALEAVAGEVGAWAELCDAYVVAAGRAEDEQLRRALWLRIACAQLVSTGDVEAVVAAVDRVRALGEAAEDGAYLDVVEARIEHIDRLEGLAMVCAELGDHLRRARCLSRALSMTEDPARRAWLHHSLAEAHVDLCDTGTAEWHLREAIALEPHRADRHAALAALVLDRGDRRTAARILERAAAGSAEAAFEAASLYEDLDENTQASQLYELAVAADPGHVRAALRLADRYYHSERWQEVEPLFDLLLHRHGELPPQGIGLDELRLRAARVAAELGKDARARTFLAGLLAAEPAHAEALELLARVHTASGDARAAAEILEQLLAHHGGRLDPYERADILADLGIAYRRMGESASAADRLERALSISTRLVRAGVTLAEIYAERGDAESALEVYRDVLEHQDDAAKIETLCTMATLCSRSLGDVIGAISLYRSARAIDPTRRDVLHQLIEHYVAAEMWRQAVDAMIDTAELENAPLRRGKYYQAAGVIAVKELGVGEAVAHLSRALDCFFVEADELPDPLRAGCMKSFTDIVRVLYDEGDFQQLESQYRAMIRRLGPQDPALGQLWQDLGHIYRQHLAGGGAGHVDGEAGRGRRVLVDLFEVAKPQEIEETISRRAELVAAEPTSPEHYSAIFKLCLRRGHLDRAWCAARALVYLGRATADEQSYFAQHQPASPPWPVRPLTRDLWARLRHPDESGPLSTILSLVAGTICAAELPEADLHHSAASEHDDVRGILTGVAYALGVAVPAAHVLPEQGGEVDFAQTRGNGVFVIGRQVVADSELAGRVERLSRAVALARPEAVLRVALGSPVEVDAALLAAVSLCRSDFVVPAELAPVVTRFASCLREGLEPADRVRLIHATDALVESGRRYDVGAWWHGASATAHRAALLLTADLGLVAARIAANPESSPELLGDILVHSVSEEHVTLRELLGIAVA